MQGFLYGKYRNNIPKRICKFNYLSLIVFPVMMLFYEKKHYIYITPVYNGEMSIGDIITINGFRWSIGLVGCIFVLTLLKIVFSVCCQNKKMLIIGTWLSKLGQNSMSIYCLSVSLLSWYLPRIYNNLIVERFGNVFAENWIVYNLIFTPMLTICYCITLYYLVCMMKKWKVHQVVFGR